TVEFRKHALGHSSPQPFYLYFGYQRRYGCKKAAHNSLNSPVCSCVSITLPALTLDDLGGSDFYLYTNLPGARLRNLCSPSHLLKQRGAKGVVMRITKAFADLRQQIHDDLRRQHPEWVLPNGESPMCDAYEARLMELLEPSAPPLSLRGGMRPSKWRLNYER